MLAHQVSSGTARLDECKAELAAAEAQRTKLEEGDEESDTEANTWTQVDTQGNITASNKRAYNF